ncbi:MAG: hypothetical protein ACE5LF_02800 [Alphaproteobacteria bacterium]
MYEADDRDEEHRRLALSILDTSERELIEQFMRCDRREALDFLKTAAEAYRMRCEDHIAEAGLYKAAAEKLDYALARLRGEPARMSSVAESSSGGAAEALFPTTPEVDPSA